MLILTRRPGETLEIDGGKIEVTVLDIKGRQVRIGINAPPDVTIHRKEVAERIRAEEAGQEE